MGSRGTYANYPERKLRGVARKLVGTLRGLRTLVKHDLWRIPPRRMQRLGRRGASLISTLGVQMSYGELDGKKSGVCTYPATVTTNPDLRKLVGSNINPPANAIFTTADEHYSFGRCPKLKYAAAAPKISKQVPGADRPECLFKFSAPGENIIAQLEPLRQNESDERVVGRCGCGSGSKIKCADLDLEQNVNTPLDGLLSAVLYRVHAREGGQHPEGAAYSKGLARGQTRAVPIAVGKVPPAAAILRDAVPSTIADNATRRADERTRQRCARLAKPPSISLRRLPVIKSGRAGAACSMAANAHCAVSQPQALPALRMHRLGFANASAIAQDFARVLSTLSGMESRSRSLSYKPNLRNLRQGPDRDRPPLHAQVPRIYSDNLSERREELTNARARAASVAEYRRRRGTPTSCDAPEARAKAGGWGVHDAGGFSGGVWTRRHGTPTSCDAPEARAKAGGWGVRDAGGFNGGVSTQTRNPNFLRCSRGEG
ncbi:hypothetical protein GGX14DRAFT_669153 [Mycena pura]|uniref:Uncharacterized protein n=1 Tax=Mycena pura TaxID=153505 RepID=A0AAD6VS54_9AGAR|nr:hypothetical protein GGX14DRAFT_669153 [Mycena pura]